ncbi:HEAT repeat domain-containing protein [Candidatus Thorarchaeota archaeon]|nr:MAG: HEAT repeat domain-containing protein [Candidatus Thorarchaeota archaeon]
MVLEDLLERPNETTWRKTAEYINNHPSEFRQILEQAFDERSEECEVYKHRLLDVVDYIEPKSAIEVVGRALGDSAEKTRIRGLKAAYRRQMDPLIPEVLGILNDKNEDFEARKWAIHILGSIDPDAFGKTLRNLARTSRENIQLRSEAIFSLTNDASDKNLGALCALLGDPISKIRHSSAWALSKIGSPETIPCLLAALEDPETDVRDWAIRALRDMDDTRALQGLADALANCPPNEQVRMIRLLIERRSEIILRAIAELLESTHSRVRRQAAWAMGVSPYPPAAGALERLLDDDDRQVRMYAKKALARLGQVDPTDLGFIL